MEQKESFVGEYAKKKHFPLASGWSSGIHLAPRSAFVV